MKHFTLIGLVAVAVCSHAIVLDDFEHNNPGLYTLVGPSGSIVAPNGAAAFSGSFGGMFGGAPAAFAARQDIVTAPDNIYTAMVRTTTTVGNGGRVYLGVGGSAGGAYSAVFAPNTQQLLIQNNTGWAFTTVQTVAATITQGTWYQLQLSWAGNGDMQASMYDQAGTTLLAQTGVWASGATTPGWLVMRGFSITANSTMIDDINMVVPEPGTIAAISIGVLALAARRRKR
jgi:hypothetical protein